MRNSIPESGLSQAEGDSETIRADFDFPQGVRGKHFKLSQAKKVSETSCVANFQDSLESLLVWIREQPSHYAVHVGELDSVLWHLHMVWAKLVDRESEYSTARMQVGGVDNLGLLTDSERTIRIDPEDEVTQRVTDFWEKVDDALQIKVRCDTWHEK